MRSIDIVFLFILSIERNVKRVKAIQKFIDRLFFWLVSCGNIKWARDRECVLGGKRNRETETFLTVRNQFFLVFGSYLEKFDF